MHDNLISAFEALARENPRATIRYCRVGSLEEITLGDCDSTWHGRYRELAHKAANAFNIPRGFRGWLMAVYKNHPADGPARKGRAQMEDGKSEPVVEEEISNAAAASAFVVRLLAVDADAGAKNGAAKGSKATRPRNRRPGEPTQKQLEAIQLYGEHGNFTKVAAIMRIDRSTVRQHYKNGLRNAGSLASGMNTIKPKTQRLNEDRRGQAVVTSKDQGRGVHTLSRVSKRVTAEDVAGKARKRG